jgi:hypothetical protein
MSLALHLLSGALETAPLNPVVLNELGVVYLRLERYDCVPQFISISDNLI